LNDLEYSSQLEGSGSSTAHYYKGVIYYKKKKIV